jgi:hypothetical protein
VEFAYRPEIWRDLFDMAALAAVTLTGLLSVGLSINHRAIRESPAHMARAREALLSLTVLLTVSIFVLIPEQGRVALGIELLVLSGFVWVVSLRLQSQTVHRLPVGARRAWIWRLIGLDTAILAISLGGVSLVIGRLGGFLWLLVHVLICLVWSTYNAWNLAIEVVARDP